MTAGKRKVRTMKEMWGWDERLTNLIIQLMEMLGLLVGVDQLGRPQKLAVTSGLFHLFNLQTIPCEAANLDVFFFLDFGHFLVLLET